MSVDARNLPVSVEQILDLALEYKASDIHFKSGMAPVLRIDGSIRAVSGLPVFTPEALEATLLSLLTPRQRDEFDQKHEIDIGLQFANKARVRVNLYTDLDALGAAMRIIPLVPPSLVQLGLPSIIEELTHSRSGLILVTGVTGAGKSTTLAGMLDCINERELAHIYTMEDPVEFVHRPKRCIITQREIGFSTRSFATALRVALRADPNVLLIGELRDRETILGALRGAETGLLVLSTLHTSSAPKTIQRIMGMFDSAEQEQICQQLANSLKAVIAQQLLPLRDGGRMAVHEIMLNNLTIQEAILANNIEAINEYIRNSTFEGMQTMDGSIYNAYREGFIDSDTARRYALNQVEMERVLKGASSGT